MKVAFETVRELSQAIDELLAQFPAALYYNVNTIAPFPDFQSHDGYEIYYVKKGDGGYLVDDHIYPIKPGSLVLIRPHTLHKVLQNSPESTIGRHVLLFKPSFATAAHFAPDSHPLSDFKESCIHIQVNPMLQERIERLYADIHDELVNRQRGSYTIVQSLVKQLLTLVHRSYISRETMAEATHLMRLPKELSFLVQYLSSNFQQKISLNSLARLVHMNATYVATLFHKHTGYTIRKYVAIRRIHHAKKLLRETDLPISVIATESGFSNTSYFIKVFRQQENLTPLLYKNNLKHADINKLDSKDRQ